MGEIVWAGLFAQAEYSTDKWSSFLSASITNESYRYHDKGGNVDGKKISDFYHFQPWSVKAGYNYKFNRNHNVFVNGGYFTRAPFSILYSLTIMFLPMLMLLMKDYDI